MLTEKVYRDTLEVIKRLEAQRDRLMVLAEKQYKIIENQEVTINILRAKLNRE